MAAEAEASGDARGALRAYKAAANGGDLEALNIVADAYRDGYVRAQTASAEQGVTFLPILTWPGQGDRWQARYKRERDEAAQAGDPVAWMRVAQDLTFGKETRANRDSAQAIRQRLVDADYGPALIHAAMSSWGDNPARSDSLLRRAEGAGNAQACHIRVTWGNIARTPEELDISAEATAAYIDALEACPPLPTDGPQGGAMVVEKIRRSTLPNAAAHLDSLRALGVFDRHPRLARL